MFLFSFINKGIWYQHNYPVFEHWRSRSNRLCICFLTARVKSFLKFSGILFQILAPTLKRVFVMIVIG